VGSEDAECLLKDLERVGIKKLSVEDKLKEGTRGGIAI